MQLSIVKNAKRNIIFGIINKLIVILCPFITRMFVKNVLGLQYLGLSSLFSSILDVISLSELGFSSAIIFFMYKPLSQNDTKTVNALLNFYKKVYRLIGIAILVLGIGVMPFINNLISGDVPRDINIYYLYIIYLINTAASYFLYAYMSSIIVVNQRDDINSIINSATKIFLTVSQILLLFSTKNYYYFIIVMPAFTIINNLWIAIVVKKEFPSFHADGSIDINLLSKIKKNVIGAFIQKCCSTTRNAIDSICVSAFLGITLTGIYNNYYFIIMGVSGLLTVYCNSLLGGIGNHVATKSISENFIELKRLDFIYINVSGWCSICLLCLYQPFMELWMGRDSLLPFGTVALMSLYFYITQIGTVRYMYMTTNGLFWEHRWRSLVETFANVILNIVLGKHFGINGIIVATMISLIACNFIWANKITFGKYFGEPYLKKYYSYQAKYFAINIVLSFVVLGVCTLVRAENVLVSMVFKLLICVLLPGLIYIIIYKKDIKDVRRYL